MRSAVASEATSRGDGSNVCALTPSGTKPDSSTRSWPMRWTRSVIGEMLDATLSRLPGESGGEHEHTIASSVIRAAFFMGAACYRPSLPARPAVDNGRAKCDKGVWT